jgi:hypothetical protein
MARDNQDRIKKNIERLGGIQSTIPSKHFEFYPNRYGDDLGKQRVEIY